MNVAYSKLLLARLRLPISRLTLASIVSIAVPPSIPAIVSVEYRGTEQRHANPERGDTDRVHGGPKWISAWTSPAVSPPDAGYPIAMRDYKDQTVRQRFRAGANGSQIRLVLTNELGDTALRVGAVHFAKCDEEGLLIAGTDRALTFSGQKAITIPPGAPAYSDPIDFDINPDTEVAVSAFFPQRSRPLGHLTRVMVSSEGDHTSETSFPGATPKRGPTIASRLDVISIKRTRVVVTLGDSITAGAGSTPGAHRDWPSQLAHLLLEPRRGRWTVLNSGTEGNRLLHSDAGEGPDALSRFDRDVAAIPGVTDVILLEGINDIGFGDQRGLENEAVSAQEIIDAYKQLIARAHAHGITIIGGTLTPYQHAAYYTLEGEKKRQSVNRFIRSGAFDCTIDFDAAVRDPHRMLQLSPNYQ